jgi:hypothetical protein
VDSAWYLHLLSIEKELDFFVLFSSTASLLSAPGQGNYAAGNAFMDALAHWRSTQGLLALSVNWGPAEVGMFAAARDRDQRRLIDQGMIAMSPELGIHVLAKLVAQATSQVSVLSVDWKKFYQSQPRAKEFSLLAHLYKEFEKQCDTNPKSGLTPPRSSQRWIRCKGDNYSKTACAITWREFCVFPRSMLTYGSR